MRAHLRGDTAHGLPSTAQNAFAGPRHTANPSSPLVGTQHRLAHIGMGIVVQRAPVEGPAGVFTDPLYPNLRMARQAPNKYLTTTGVTLYYDDGRYSTDADGVHQADMSAFQAAVQNDHFYYHSAGTVVLVPIDEILRELAVGPKELAAGLDQGRLTSMTAAMRLSATFPPIVLHRGPVAQDIARLAKETGASKATIAAERTPRYFIAEGRHRFVAAMSAKFATVPAIVQAVALIRIPDSYGGAAFAADHKGGGGGGGGGGGAAMPATAAAASAAAPQPGAAAAAAAPAAGTSGSGAPSGPAGKRNDDDDDAWWMH